MGTGNLLIQVRSAEDALPLRGVRVKIKNHEGTVLYDLMIGQILLIPGTDTTTPSFSYTVRSGDTLWLLAQRFNTTVAAIKALNNLTSDVLMIGQVLLIPGTETTTPSFSYTVRSGDTLWLLAQRFNTTVVAIKALNNLSSDVLMIGQVLLIPQ